MTARLPQTVRVAKLCSSLPPEKYDEVVRIVRDLEDEVRAVRRGRDLVLWIQDHPDEEPRKLTPILEAEGRALGLLPEQLVQDRESLVLFQGTNPGTDE